MSFARRRERAVEWMDSRRNQSIVDERMEAGAS